MQRRLYIDEAHTALDIFRFAVFFSGKSPVTELLPVADPDTPASFYISEGSNFLKPFLPISKEVTRKGWVGRGGDLHFSKISELQIME